MRCTTAAIRSRLVRIWISELTISCFVTDGASEATGWLRIGADFKLTPGFDEEPPGRIVIRRQEI